jgi:hypothetical protein
MKFIKVTDQNDGRIVQRLINVDHIVNLATEPVNYAGVEELQLTIICTQNRPYFYVLTSQDSNVLGIITEFLENDDTVLDITSYVKY